MLYHYVVEGRLVAQIPGAEPLEIEAGEVVMVPHNHEHLLGSSLDVPPVPARDVVQALAGGRLSVIRHGGGGDETRIVCGPNGEFGTYRAPLLSKPRSQSSLAPLCALAPAALRVGRRCCA